MLESNSFSQSSDFQFERIIEKMVDDKNKIVEEISTIKCEKIYEDEIKINAEINLENMTCNQLEVVNIEFEIK